MGKEVIVQNKTRILGMGILSIIFGILGIFLSVEMTVTSIIAFGIMMLIGGAMFLLELFSIQGWKEKIFDFSIAILYVVSGVTIILNPATTAIWFTFFIAAFFIAIGIVRIIMSVKLKDKVTGWGWVTFGGFLDIALGIMIYQEWPESSKWVIGLFISIEFLIQGIAAVILYQKVKNLQKGDDIKG